MATRHILTAAAFALIALMPTASLAMDPNCPTGFPGPSCNQVNGQSSSTGGTQQSSGQTGGTTSTGTTSTATPTPAQMQAEIVALQQAVAALQAGKAQTAPAAAAQRSSTGAATGTNWGN